MTKCFLPFIALFLLFSCSKENSDSNQTITEPVPTAHTPVVFLHGFLASGDTYEKQVKRFTSNGYSLADLYVFDWNTLDFSADNVGNLNKFVDSVLAKTGKSQVDLVGHSAGTRVVQDYTSRHRNKIKHLVLLAGFPPDRQDSTPILNIYSSFDFIASGGKDVNGGTNVKQTDKDHYEVATSKETFVAMYKFFNDGASPANLEYTEENDVILSGKSGSFGENKFLANTNVEIYKVDPATGFRINSVPDAVFKTDAKGFWGPYRADKNAYYEFVVYDDVTGSRKVHYYREPFKRSDKLVYLRTFPTGLSIAGLFLSSLPKDDRLGVTAFFGASQAAVAGRDALVLDGNVLSINKFCSKENTTIALFAYDDNKNKNTDLFSLASFSSFPFLKGADIYFPTISPQSVVMTFNGRILKAANWKSGSEGVNVMVFE
ncbi:MAG: alpha/beta fold hydrolase [Sphingobacteriales bacterium]|nr:alpha/beta fold hydrolase [Sphingobacteriales bacterium]